MKKNKKRIKKKPLIVLILLLIVIFLDIYLYFDSTNYKLRKKGYTDDNIKVINNILDDSSKNIVSSLDYNKNILFLLNDKNFDDKNFSEYIKYYKENSDIDYDANIVLIINDKYYLKNNYEKYIDYYKLNKTLSARKIVENVNCNLDKEYYTTDYKTDLTKNNLILVNKYNKVENDYVPSNLVIIDKKYGNSKKISKVAYDAYIKMFNAAKNDNMGIYITSAYRSYNYQQNLYNNYVKSSGKAGADKFSARAGYSEHQTGLAIDISSQSMPYTKFKETPEYDWMLKNCYKYGYILRYPEGKESQTGYMFESWHYRYVGEKVAKYISENSITYDEYYEYFIK